MLPTAQVPLRHLNTGELILAGSDPGRPLIVWMLVPTTACVLSFRVGLKPNSSPILDSERVRTSSSILFLAVFPFWNVLLTVYLTGVRQTGSEDKSLNTDSQ